MFENTNVKEINITGSPIDLPFITSTYGMFSSCQFLSKINFYNINFSKIVTMENMFYRCYELSFIDLSNLDMKNLKSLDYMFFRCNSLKSVDFSNSEFYSLETMQSMFFNCHNLSSLNLFKGSFPNLVNMEKSFFGCYNLVSLDLSDFKVTNLKNIEQMFYLCSNLQIIIFNVFVTSNVKSMKALFYSCISLKSLDLSSFDTKNVEIMQEMFYNCRALEHLNITHFDLSNVKNMGDMFHYCGNLSSIELNLTNSLVENISDLFSNCESLTSVNLINFNMSKITSVYNVFKGCSNLEYINMNKSSYGNTLGNFFSDIVLNAVICTEKSYENNIYIFVNSSFCLNWDCSENWKNNKNKIIYVNESSSICVKECNIYNNFPYLYEYENVCYKQCPNGTYIYRKNNHLCTINYNESKDYEEDHEEKAEEEFDCAPKDFFIKKCTQNITNNTENSDYIFYIINSIEEGSFKPIFEETVKNNTNFIINSEKFTYQISTTKSQYSTNLSTINLDQLEILLKQKYDLDMDTPLILFKIEYKIDEFNIPIIEYLLFSEDGKKLNLSGFENISTTFSIPVSIDESKEYLHDPKSDFYNDKCTTYTSEAGTDISIYDRKNDYNKNYLSLCESNCEYKGYNSTNKRIECECNIKTDIISFMNIEIDKDKLLDKFINFKQNSNLFVIYCYKLFFNKNGLSTNLGSYLIIIFIVISVFGFIYFLKFGYKIYKIQISGIIYQGVIN